MEGIEGKIERELKRGKIKEREKENGQKKRQTDKEREKEIIYL